MNIVTKFSLILILFIYLFYIPVNWKNFFCSFFRALGEPLDQDSVPVGQALKYTWINGQIH